jgi:hypothetical protein
VGSIPTGPTAKNSGLVVMCFVRGELINFAMALGNNFTELSSVGYGSIT